MCEFSSCVCGRREGTKRSWREETEDARRASLPSPPLIQQLLILSARRWEAGRNSCWIFGDLWNLIGRGPWRSNTCPVWRMAE